MALGHWANLEGIRSARTILLIKGLGTVVITRSGKLTEHLGTVCYLLVVKNLERISVRISVEGNHGAFQSRLIALPHSANNSDC